MWNCSLLVTYSTDRVPKKALCKIYIMHVLFKPEHRKYSKLKKINKLNWENVTLKLAGTCLKNYVKKGKKGWWSVWNKSLWVQDCCPLMDHIVHFHSHSTVNVVRMFGNQNSTFVGWLFYVLTVKPVIYIITIIVTNSFNPLATPIELDAAPWMQLLDFMLQMEKWIK